MKWETEQHFLLVLTIRQLTSFLLRFQLLTDTCLLYLVEVDRTFFVTKSEYIVIINFHIAEETDTRRHLNKVPPSVAHSLALVSVLTYL